MSFIKENGTAALLLAAVFMSLGFILGKVTNSHKGHKGCHKNQSCSHDPHRGHDGHADCVVWISDDDALDCLALHSSHGEMIIVEALMEEGFEGDTVIVIPGGEIIIKMLDGDVDVELNIDDDDGHSEVKIIKIVTD